MYIVCYVKCTFNLHKIIQTVCEEIINVIKDGAKYVGVTFKDKNGNDKFVGFQFSQKQALESCALSDFRIRSSAKNASSSSVYISKVFFPLLSVIIPKWISQTQNICLSPLIRPKSMLNNLAPNDLWEIDGNNNTKLNSNDHSSSNESIPKPPKPQQNDSPEIEYYSSDANEDNVQTDATEEKYNETMKKFTKKRHLQHPICNNFDDAMPTTFKLFLVSGAGHSSKKQSNFYEEGDSTQQLAALLCHFISDFYPQVKVKQFYSGSNIFHYLENIKFVHSHLRPAIDVEREKLAKMHGKIWQKFFSLSLSLCDGTPARLSAIVEGLRSFEPNMLHMFRKKTLWTNYPKVTKLWEDDFEFLQFAEMITYPAIPIQSIQDQDVINTVQRMKEWRDSFIAAAEEPSCEMSRFWLRKTHQPVLAILSVQKPNDEHVTYYKGINVEVSMPTGSLCAERNAIGTALANDPALRREHFKMIAVLFMAELEKDKCPNTSNQSYNTSPQRSFGNQQRSYYIPEENDINPRGPCGSCMEWLTKIAQCNPSFKVITFSSRSLDKVIVRNLK